MFSFLSWLSFNKAMEHPRAPLNNPKFILAVNASEQVQWWGMLPLRILFLLIVNSRTFLSIPEHPSVTVVSFRMTFHVMKWRLRTFALNSPSLWLPLFVVDRSLGILAYPSLFTGNSRGLLASQRNDPCDEGILRRNSVKDLKYHSLDSSKQSSRIY